MAHRVNTLPASPADVTRYLTVRFRAGAKIAAIGELRASAGYPRPTDAEVVH